MEQRFRVNDPKERYPQTVVSFVPWLDDEFQLEQGFKEGDTDLGARSNDVISISRAQAVKIARTILAMNEQFPVGDVE